MKKFLLLLIFCLSSSLLIGCAERIPEDFKFALKTAENLIQEKQISKTTLKKLLTTSDGGNYYSEAAEYAVNNVQVDWKEKAKNYLTNFKQTVVSKKKALKILSSIEPVIFVSDESSFEGGAFTDEEAIWAIENTDLNWNENAVIATRKVETNLRFFSKVELEELLLKDYEFEEENLIFAIEKLKIDFEKQALNMAEQKTISADNRFGSSFSRKAVLEDLKFIHRFSDDEISYVEKNLKVNFKKVALNKASSIELDNWGISGKELENLIYSQLVEMYSFTEEEAKFAVDNLHNRRNLNLPDYIE